MTRREKGFTIIELIVVVTIIGLLAAVTVFAFGSWRSRTARTEVRNELLQASAALQNYRNFNNDYPLAAAFSSVYTPGGSVTLTYIKRAAGTYCLNGTSTADGNVKWYIDSAVNDKSTQSGTCA